MCGIMGYVGHRSALPILLDGLRRLEYRGYDSAGVAVLNDGHIEVRKTAGKLAQLTEITSGPGLLHGTVGIGHTRWATHGLPTDANAHPHSDCGGRVVVIHNGIIENFLPLKEELQARGHTFRSDTDTEVIAHLIEEELYGHEQPGTREPPRPLGGLGAERGNAETRRSGSLRITNHESQVSLEEAVRRAVQQTRGAYAIVVLCSDQPDRIVAVRQISPLIIGLGKGETILASDIPALLSHTRDVLVIEDGEMAVMTASGATVERLDGATVAKQPLRITWDAEMAEKGGYPHFMLKEIHEQPRALQETMMGRLDAPGAPELDGVSYSPEFVRGLRKLWITACGTAYHAGLVGRWVVEHWAKIPVEPELASELRYRDALIDPQTLTVAISQSGETADTLAAAREARKRGTRLAAITNVVGSTLSREADDVLYVRAGPEIAVASSKAYITMLVALQMLALDLAVRRGTVTPPRVAHIIQEVKARGGLVIAVAYDRDTEITKHTEVVLRIPDTLDDLAPVLAIIPLQLFAYYVARERGNDIDQPRNLAKSVTVE